MKYNYRILQYSDDPIRSEYRNFAVIIWGEKEITFRTLGLRERGGVDLDEFAPLLDRTPLTELWVFREWIDWLWQFGSPGSHGGYPIMSRPLRQDGHDEFLNLADGARPVDSHLTMQMVDAALAKLVQADGYFRVTGLGVVEGEGWKSILDAADGLAARLLGDPTGFATRVEDLLLRTEVDEHYPRSRNVLIQWPSSEGGLRLAHFDGVVDAPTRTLLKYVPFRGTTAAQMTRYLNDTLSVFALAQEMDFAYGADCVVLADTPRSDQMWARDAIAGSYHVIDVEADEAPDNLRLLLRI